MGLHHGYRPSGNKPYGYVEGDSLFTDGYVEGDSFFNYTVLLLQGNETNGAQNNTFLDESTNNYTITRSGNVTQGSFNPNSLAAGQWSNFFDGTGDFLSIPNNAAIHVLGNDFCLEGWFYLTAAQGNYGLYSTYTATSGYLVRLDTTYIRFYCESSPSDITVDRNYTFNRNQWYHFAVTNSGGTGRIFIDGVQQGATFTFDTPTNSTTTLQIGQTHTLTNAFPGYLSNFRVVKGSAVYTSNFTPSGPLTAITNTTSLTCQSNRFVDNSTNNFSITRNGDTRVTPFSPFASTVEYSKATYGGSSYFDGTGDYLTIASNGLAITTGQFTLDTWIYIDNLSIARYIFENAKWQFGHNGGYRVYIDTDLSVKMAASNSVWNQYPLLIASTEKVKPREWNHIAIVRNSSDQINIYINGVSTTTPVTRSATLNYNTGGGGVVTSRIGVAIADGGLYNLWVGHIATLRLITGSCLYTGNFTPPSSSLTAVEGTKFLCNFNNAGIIDSTGKNVFETVGNAQIDTTVKKFGTGSLEFDGSGDYLVTNSDPGIFAFGTGDFTVEFWYYSNNTGVQQVVYDSRPASTNGAYMVVYKQSGNVFSIYISSAARITGTTSINASTWYHIAVCRSGTSTKLFVNGVQDGSTYTDSNSYLNPANRPIIGADGSTLGATPVNGFIDDLRVTRYARYTSNFSIPESEFLAR